MSGGTAEQCEASPISTSCCIGNNRNQNLSASVRIPLKVDLSTHRPDNLLTNFVAWRGLLTKMLCSLYNHQEPWKVAATLYRGTIYLQEIETEEKKRQEASMPPQQRATCYWGLKFEDYVTSKGRLVFV